VNGSSEDPVERIRKLTEGGVDVAFDTVGAGHAPIQIAQAAKPGILGVRDGGMGVLVGIPQAEVPVNLWRMLHPTKIYRSSFGGSCRPVRDFPVFLDWYRTGRLKLDELVTRRYALDQINEGVEDLQQGRIFGRSILTF
jgi:S-(hydroxymethyl)glutathione dehydrogenase/alcohol dehydrogenase